MGLAAIVGGIAIVPLTLAVTLYGKVGARAAAECAAAGRACSPFIPASPSAAAHVMGGYAMH